MKLHQKQCSLIVSLQFRIFETQKQIPISRRCEWQGLELRCLVKAGAPSGQPVPRDFNYIIAHLPDLAAQQLSTQLGLPLITTPTGETVANLEIARFKNQGKHRRATLI